MGEPMDGIAPSADGYAAALVGMQRAGETMSEVARTVLESGVSPEAVVSMKLARAQLAASAGVIRALDEGTGVLLSELA